MDAQAARENLVELKGVKKYYPISGGFLSRQKGFVKAVDGIDLAIRRGETLGLVGESGCGKSTLGRVILRLDDPTEGEIVFDGQDIAGLSKKELRRIRNRMQIIFQDPYSSLNPRQTIGRIIKEGMVIHRMGTPKERDERVRHLMEVVGLRPEYISRYPHEFSGGQRQRIGIARALALNPELIICDEPLSALDVSIQAQIINLLQDLQAEFNLTYLFISHDLSIVRHITDRVAVMYHGRIVELADKAELYTQPFHPYTKTLLDAVPIPDPNIRNRKRRQLGDNGSAVIVPSNGCNFHPRCSDATPECRDEIPDLREIGPQHWVRCFHS